MLSTGRQKFEKRSDDRLVYKQGLSCLGYEHVVIFKLLDLQLILMVTAAGTPSQDLLQNIFS